MTDRPARHDLLAVEPADWAAAAATRGPLPPLSPEAVALVERWGAAGWPVIARRPTPGDPPGAVPVGLPLTSPLGRARVALVLPAPVRWRILPRVALAGAAAAAPASWAGAIDALLRLGASLGLVPAVFGALLWQRLTGLPYVRAASDIDLLWPVEDPDTLPRLLAGLAAIDGASPMRIDGEVLTARGGINWRELDAARLRGPGVVLAKSMDRAGFVAAADLFAPAGPPCS